MKQPAQKRQKAVLYAIIISEFSHIFCCVLPTVFTLVALMVNLGMVSAMPAGFEALHDIMHKWELPIVVFSGVMLGLGWFLHRRSLVQSCETTGCERVHEPCAPTKSKTLLFLKIATVLFFINVFVFLVIHRGLGVTVSTAPHAHEAHAHDDGHNHGH